MDVPFIFKISVSHRWSVNTFIHFQNPSVFGPIIQCICQSFFIFFLPFFGYWQLVLGKQGSRNTYILFPSTEYFFKQKHNKQTKTGPANLGLENVVLKPVFSCISGSIFNWYLLIIQLALDQINFFFHAEDTTRFSLPDSLSVRYYHVIEFYQKRVSISRLAF